MTRPTLLLALSSALLGPLSCATTPQTTSPTAAVAALPLKALRNPALRVALAGLEAEPKRQLSALQATKLLIAVVQEPLQAARLLDYLLTYYRKRGISYDKHQVMLAALRSASPDLIAALLERKVYHRGYFTAQVHYSFLDHCTLLHLLYLLIMEVFNYKISYFLPGWVELTWDGLGMVGLALSLVTLLFKPPWLLTVKAKLGLLRPKTALFLLQLGKLYYALTLARRLALRPDYVFLVLQGLRSREERMAIALLLLQAGAKPGAEVLLVRAQEGLPEEITTLLGPAQYQVTSALHLAAEEGMLPVVQALLKAGLPVNALALTTQDRLHYEMPAGETPPAILPVTYQSMNDLYERKGLDGSPQTALQLAPPGSPTAAYLKAQGGKAYQPAEAKPRKS